MNIIAQSDIQHLVTDELPDLGNAIRDLLGRRVRRIDRYIELCLLGALRCTQECSPPAETGLFLASQNNSIGSVVTVMESILDEHYPPKPFDFVNTLGNSACFYVAQLLGLSGKSIVLSREGFSFEAGLQHALLDLHSGQLQTALVGCVDEALLPLSSHRVRIASDKEMPIEGPLGENSSWLLLSNHNSGASGFRLDTILEFSAQTDVLAWLAENVADQASYMQTCYRLGKDDRAAISAQVTSLEEYQAPFAVAGSNTNSALSTMALLANTQAHKQHPTLLHLNKNGDGDYVLLRFVAS
jgi:hypothetical protein